MPIGATQLEPVNILGSYMQGLELGRANRLSQAQQAAAIQQAQREAELRNYLSTADLSSPEAQRNLLRFGKSGAEIAKSIGEAETSALTREKTQLEIAAEKRKVAKSRLESMIGLLRGAVDEPSYQERLAIAGQQGFDLTGVPQQYNKSWIDSQLGQLLPLKDQLDEEERQFQRGIKKREVGVSEANVGLRRREAELSERKFEREGDLDFQARAEQFKAAGKFKGEALAKAEADLPGAVSRADTAIDLIDQMIGKKGEKGEAAKPHPGFRGAVGAGVGTRFVPGTDAAGFQALYDQVTGGAFLQAYETLKGTGQITEVEGKKATAAITRMNLAQSESEFIKAAREFQDAIRGGVERARNKAGAPSQAASEDQQALDWANANPNDPRSAQIKARLGVR